MTGMVLYLGYSNSQVDKRADLPTITLGKFQSRSRGRDFLAEAITNELDHLSGLITNARSFSDLNGWLIAVEVDDVDTNNLPNITLAYDCRRLVTRLCADARGTGREAPGSWLLARR